MCSLSIVLMMHFGAQVTIESMQHIDEKLEPQHCLSERVKFEWKELSHHYAMVFRRFHPISETVTLDLPPHAHEGRLTYRYCWATGEGTLNGQRIDVTIDSVQYVQR